MTVYGRLARLALERGEVAQAERICDETMRAHSASGRGMLAMTQFWRDLRHARGESSLDVLESAIAAMQAPTPRALSFISHTAWYRIGQDYARETQGAPEPAAVPTQQEMVASDD